MQEMESNLINEPSQSLDVEKEGETGETREGKAASLLKQETQKPKKNKHKQHSIIDLNVNPLRRAQKLFKYSSIRQTDFTKLIDTQGNLVERLYLEGKSVIKFRFPSGAFLVKEFLSAEEQVDIAQLCVNEFVQKPYRTNLSGGKGLYEDSSESEVEVPSESKESPTKEEYCFNERIRWSNLGFNYDWTHRTYPKTKTNVPKVIEDISARANVLYNQLVGDKNHYTPEAVIVNYYKEKDTMTSHLDDAEEDQKSPIYSFALGLNCVFLIGDTHKDAEPLAIEISSGDLFVMSGHSRRCYHGVPRVLAGSYQPQSAPKECQGSPNTQRQTIAYLKTHRININIRVDFVQIMISQQQILQLQEMGFSADDIQRSALIAAEKKTDILDVLTKSAAQNPQPQQRGAPQLLQSQPARTEQTFKYRPFIQPKEKFRLEDYECVYREASGSASVIVREEIRQAGIPPVLENVSNCCYLNSLLMAYFLMPSFVRLVMKARPLSKEQLDSLVPNTIKNKRIERSYNLLTSVQELFAHLAISTRKSINPGRVLETLVDHFGEKIKYGEEKDLNEMNHHLISRLQECLHYTQTNIDNLKKDSLSDGFKSEIMLQSLKPQLKDLLFGTKTEISTTDEESRVEESQFQSLLLNPVHGSLSKCLEEQLHYEVDNEGKKIKKDIWIHRPPEHLFFYIQRTGYDQQTGAIKIKDRVEFDFEIYLDRYLYENKEAESKRNPAFVKEAAKRDDLFKEVTHSKDLLHALEESIRHLGLLKNKVVTLPDTEPLKQSIKDLERELDECKQAISQMESRQHPYLLKYIIAHRGSMSSGHYWGYGESGKWVRYDLSNTSVTREDITKQLSEKDVVIYALIYERRQKHLIHPNFQKYLKVPELDMLADEEEQYIDWIDPALKARIISDNLKRQNLWNERSAWETYEEITIQYDSIITELKDKAHKNKLEGRKEPYLDSFGIYLLSLSKDPSSLWKLFCLDLAINKVTQKYSISDQPNEEFSKQLREVVSNNMKSENVPDKFKASKFDTDKLKERFSEYITAVKVRLSINAMFSNMREERWGRALDWGVVALQLSTPDLPDRQVAKEISSVLMLKQGELNHPIPQEYLKELEEADPSLSRKLVNILKTVQSVETNEVQPLKESIARRVEEVEAAKGWSKLGGQLSQELEVDSISPGLKLAVSSLGDVIRKYRQLV